MKSADWLAVASALLASYSCKRYLDLRREADDYVASAFAGGLNNTVGSDPDVLVFNRVPKAASETVWTLLDHLAADNGFNSTSDDRKAKMQRGGENTFMPNQEERKTYVDMLLGADHKPLSYTKHLNFIDFTEFGHERNPVYVNFVRDPVERIISWYYYVRIPSHIVKVREDDNTTVVLNPQAPALKDLKMTFEECFASGNPTCVYPVADVEDGEGGFVHGVASSHNSQIAFFCGHDPVCDRFGSRDALRVAVANVERHYAVVGVAERFQDSLAALEAYVPKFFRGAGAKYRDVVRKKFHENRNRFKRAEPDWVRRAMAPNFTVEYEFYQFCRQRLEKQLALLQL